MDFKLFILKWIYKKESPLYVSFDLYNTVLIRSVITEKEIQSLCADYVLKLIRLDSSSKSIDKLEILELRSKTFKSLKSKIGDINAEIKILYVYQGLFKSLGIPQNKLENYVSKIKKFEEELEFHSVTVSPTFKKYILYLNSKSMPIVAISDMYLPKVFLEQLLNELSIGQCFHKIFVSSEYGKKKVGGKLYQEVIGKLQIDIDKLIHFGDSYTADFASARSIGVKKAFWIPKFLNTYSSTVKKSPILKKVVAETCTAFIFYLAKLKKGERILIHAGASGVGTAAIQLAKSIGASQIIITASIGKHSLCQELGADVCIDYKTQNFEEEIKQLTDGKGASTQP